MALKNTDRVSTARVAAGDVLLGTMGSALHAVQPSTALKGAEWRTVERVELAADRGARRSPVRYVVHFTDGAATDPTAGVQHWTRKLSDDVVPIADVMAQATAAHLADQPTRTDLVDASANLDDHAVIDGPEDDGGERCGTCKGFGLVRGIGNRAGGRYKTLAGAQAAQGAGRAVDCPTCEGTGLAATLRELINA